MIAGNLRGSQAPFFWEKTHVRPHWPVHHADLTMHWKTSIYASRRVQQMINQYCTPPSFPFCFTMILESVDTKKVPHTPICIPHYPLSQSPSIDVTEITGAKSPGFGWFLVTHWSTSHGRNTHSFIMTESRPITWTYLDDSEYSPLLIRHSVLAGGFMGFPINSSLLIRHHPTAAGNWCYFQPLSLPSPESVGRLCLAWPKRDEGRKKFRFWMTWKYCGFPKNGNDWC